MPTTDFSKRLLDGETQIGIWGTGFIGFSTLVHFANEGVRCVGYDIDEDRVETINEGDVPIGSLKNWIDFDTKPLVANGLARATTDYKELLSDEVRVHFIAVPTERNGEPWGDALRDAIQKISQQTSGDTDDPVLVMVESTLQPGMSRNVVEAAIADSSMTMGEDILYGVAPRRDWFTSREKNLTEVPRVFGGCNQRTNEAMESVLGIVCNNLVGASDYEHAEIVKSVENAHRHVGITLANQLSRAYPDLDIREVLELAATKWNVPSYHPSIGIGGYCIPVASKYVLNGATHEDELRILQEAVVGDREQPIVVAEAIAERDDIDSVAVLGLAYKGDVKVDILSPVKALADTLQSHGVDVAINDPYFEDDYIHEETGAEPFSFPDGMEGYDAVLLAADHQQYQYTPNDEILGRLSDCRLVIDNPNAWDDDLFRDTPIEYCYTGAANWLDK